MQATISRSRLGVSVLLVVMLVGGLLLWTNLPAEAAKPQPLDHFRCYRVLQAEPPSAGAVVVLQDQFDIAAGATPEALVRNPEWFCNPTEKRHKNRLFEITNPDGHLKFYNIETEPGPERTIRYKNQFEKGKAVLGQARWLAVPTQKEGHPPPERLDHFKCYQVLDAEAANTVVGLQDQWQTEPQVEVGGPVMFCNPTRKIHVDTGVAVGVGNARGHLMCYRTGSDPGLVFTVFTFNQFGDELLVVGDADVLCVPTRKGKKFSIAAAG